MSNGDPIPGMCWNDAIGYFVPPTLPAPLLVDTNRETMGKLIEAEKEIERLKTERLKLDRRIHNQRVALRKNWEIMEMRSGKRAWYPSKLLKALLNRGRRDRGTQNV